MYLSPSPCPALPLPFSLLLSRVPLPSRPLPLSPAYCRRFRLELKQSKRRREQCQEETARREQDLEANRIELAEAAQELDSLRHKFRDQLESFVTGNVGGES